LYEPRVIPEEEHDSEIKYFSTPSPDIDQNWHELSECKQSKTHPSIVILITVPRVCRSEHRHLAKLNEGLRTPRRRH
jgi:hypothetical protein